MSNNVAFQKTGAQANVPPLTEYVAAPVLLERVWPDARSRPSLRWLREQQSIQAVPTTWVGRRVLFCPAHVLMFAGNKLTVLPKSAACSRWAAGHMPPPDKLIDAVGLLEVLKRDFGLNRSLRWVRQQQENRTLPFIHWGRKIFFAPAQVRATLQT